MGALLLRSLLALGVFSAVVLGGLSWADPAPPPLLIDAAAKPPRHAPPPHVIPVVPLLCVPMDIEPKASADPSPPDDEQQAAPYNAAAIS